MDSHTDLQTRVQSPPQEQTQPISPYSDGRSPATIPEDTSDIDAWALKKQLRKDLCALRRVYFPDLLSLTDAFSSQQNIWGHPGCPNLHPMENAVSTIVSLTSTTRYHDMKTVRLVAMMRFIAQLRPEYVEIKKTGLFPLSCPAYMRT
jgi:hypothetical protein